jgi:hypothetical protein
MLSSCTERSSQDGLLEKEIDEEET